MKSIFLFLRRVFKTVFVRKTDIKHKGYNPAYDPEVEGLEDPRKKKSVKIYYGGCSRG